MLSPHQDLEYGSIEREPTTSTSSNTQKRELSPHCRYTNRNLFVYLSEKSSDEDTTGNESATIEHHSERSPVVVPREVSNQHFTLFMLEVFVCVVIMVVLALMII